MMSYKDKDKCTVGQLREILDDILNNIQMETDYSNNRYYNNITNL